MSGWFGSTGGGDNATSVISGVGKRAICRCSIMLLLLDREVHHHRHHRMYNNNSNLNWEHCHACHVYHIIQILDMYMQYLVYLIRPLAVLAGMMMSQKIMNNDRSFGGGGGGGSGSGPFRHSSNASVVSSASHNRRGGGQHTPGFNVNNTNNATHNNMIPTPPIAIYLKTSHALPLPGVRMMISGN